MSTTIADLRAKIGADGVDKTKSDLKGVHGTLDQLASGFKLGLGAVTGFFTGFGLVNIATDALGFLKDQMLDVLQAGMDQQKVQAQTAAVIKSTGGAAHLSAEQVGDLADSLAKMSGVSDDTIQAAENILLTFKAIGQKTFPDATKAVLDMSVALHQDLQSTAIQVGKALQDPINGVTTLRRVGVQLSDSQIALVKHFMETGQQAKAQGVILKELTSEFGGSAEAAGKTLPGQLARLNVAWDQAKEKIGLAVIPILQSLLGKYVMPLADWLGAHLPAAISVLTGFIDNQLTPAINDLMNSPVVTTLEGWATAIASKVTPSLGDQGLKGGADAAKTGLADLSTQAGTTGTDLDDPNLAKHAKNASSAIKGIADAVTKDPGGAHPALVTLNKDLANNEQSFRNQTKNTIPAWQAAIAGAAGSWDGLTTHVNEFFNALGSFKDNVKSSFGDATKTEIGMAVGFALNLQMQGVHLQSIWEGIWATLSAPVQAGLHSVEGIVSTGMDTLDALSTGDWGKVGDDWKAMWGKILGDAQQFVRGLDQTLNDLPSWLTGGSGVIAHNNAAASTGGGAVDAALNAAMSGGGRTPGVGHRAGGGPGAGLTWVGEYGPELLNLPRGSYVYNHRQSVAMTAAAQNGGNSYTITVNAPADNEIASSIDRHIRRRELLNSWGR